MVIESNVELPFQFSAALPATLHAERVRIVFRGPLRSDQQSHVSAEEMVDLFAKAVNAKLLGYSENSHCEVVELLRTQNGSSSEYLLGLRDLRPADVLVLLSLLAQVRFAEDCIDVVTIEATSGQACVGLGALLELRDEFTDICVPDHLPFTVEVSDTFLSQIRFEFAQPISVSGYAHLEQCLGLWGHLVHLGGFCFDFAEQSDFSSQFGRAAHVLPRVVEYVWERFDGWRGAHTLLLNLARSIAIEVAPLHKVTLR